ncbi:MAG: porin family protein [Mesorhizobium sp.]|uniref:outer membrane protein n=1 Tax=unclassified Mesorhizobium TaxID=325217 RepID=UPI000FCB2F16|nr:MULTISPECIES: outer membrane protein [unclassified Mesorhizobium]RVC45454.1 porin family protein [Mesorhizobium sp. M4A.F.Ca.ET.090.04.2.1]RWC51636.1 MAG: porin family protein [Mesorhizobium sp.]RWD54571.1 MAG: porin family protein [Mesorhizobium sp.]TIU63589.1 MAG: autotransporter domain-containing protein [Mesorhizobium sp.]TIU71073.1 MAG: autotransporter domain-containing protein [Mesorhizobium sp.]
MHLGNTWLEKYNRALSAIPSHKKNVPLMHHQSRGVGSMRFIFQTTAILGLLTTSALATEAGSQLPVASTYNWSGAYVGAQAGYGWGKDDWTFLSFDNTGYYEVPAKPAGVLGGIYGGYNYQFDNGVVLGADADFTFAGLKKDGVRGHYIGSSIPDTFFSYGSKVDWTAALRGKVGYSVDRFLPYFAGGLAVARQNVNETQSLPFSHDATRTGWTLGLGLEYAATDNLVVRAEYRYSDFGKKLFQVGGGWSPLEDRLSINDLRIGAAYKF